ncbi:hypothetical protein BH10PSE18_BH10PSE18_36700 [soil metagenome]
MSASQQLRSLGYNAHTTAFGQKRLVDGNPHFFIF